ncbi:MAG: hypothetical protein ACLTK8_01655 [Paeniclostridium sp.]
MTPEIKEKLLGLINEKAYNPLKKEELALIFTYIHVKCQCSTIF